VSRPLAIRILIFAVALLVVGILLIGFDNINIVLLRYAMAGILLGVAVRLLSDLAAMPWRKTSDEGQQTPPIAITGSAPQSE
jgi:hypothetical protein